MGAWVWVLLALVLVGGSFLVGIAYFIDQFRFSSVSRMGLGGSTVEEPLREVVLEPGSSRSKIAVIDVSGIITSEPWDAMGNNLVTYIQDQLERAASDHLVKAVILKIDSPGGEVLASDEIYKLLADFQEEHEKPVIASMGTIAASGGYYVAAPCRWIVANELTITGSIGVIMNSYNWSALMEKVGVRPQVFKSGQLKDMLSPNKPLEEVTPIERQIVQNLVDETFARFKSVVEQGRATARERNADNNSLAEADLGRALDANWQDYADGRLLSGTEAWKLGLVDELGNFTVAVERAEKLADAEGARLIQYLRPMGFGSLLRLFGQSEESRVSVDFGIKVPNIRPGLYYVAPQLVR